MPTINPPKSDLRERLQTYYQNLGYTKEHWHIGGEHPAIENHAIQWMKEHNRFRILEIGYQSGGFSVPVITELWQRPNFRYVGIDSLIYPNAINGNVISHFLKSQSVETGFEFRVAEANVGLQSLAGQSFDLVLIDHLKTLYARELEIVLRNGLCAPGGIILMHDVLKRARWAWRYCRWIASVYGCASGSTSDVPEGLGMIYQPANKSATVFQRGIAKGLSWIAPPLSEIQARIAYHLGRA